jgi:Flp pilus assembly protein TadG
MRYPQSLRSIFERAKQFPAHESGVAAVEFAVILPILVVLWLGGVEVTGALSVDRRVNNYASSLGDLVARKNAITYDEIDDIFELAEAAMYPYPVDGMSMRVSAINIDDEGNATVAWSRADGTALPAFAKDEEYDEIPDELLVEGQLIMAEAVHTYHPAIGYVISGDIELEDRMFFAPRLKKSVKICPTNDPASCVDEI